MNEVIEQTKKSIFQRGPKGWPSAWFWITTIVVVAALVVLALYLFTVNEKAQEKKADKTSGTQMNSEQLQKAEIALANGITIEDAKNDFFVEEDLSVPGFQVPQFDIKSVSFGADDQYFYRKCTYWQVADKDLKIKDRSDFQMNCTNQLFNDSEQNISTKWGKGQFHQLATNYDYTESLLGIELIKDWPNGGSEAEIDYPGNPYNVKQGFGGLIYGGAGYDYVIAAWPLSVLRLKPGDATTITINTEVGAKSSKIHLAVDMVPQEAQKDGRLIKYVLGQNKYVIFDDAPKKEKTGEIKDFESCAKVYPVLETYPEQCKTPDGKIFTKKQGG